MKKCHLFTGITAALLLIPELGWAQSPGDGPSQGPQGGFGPGQGGGGFRQRGGRGGFGFDPAQMFDRFANGKEVWTRADANSSSNPWAQAMFDRISQSLNITNGQITREQFTTYMQQQANNWGGMGGGRRGNRQGGGGLPGPGNAPAGGATPSPTDPASGPANSGNRTDAWAERMFQRLDTNGDGLLNNDEMPEALRVEREKWDTNKDGFIDLNEFKAFFQASIQQRMAENGGWNPNWQGGGMPDPTITPIPMEEEEVKKPTVYRAGNLPKDIPAWFKQYDTDGDGQIGLYEWKATGESLEKFRQIDRNNDGFLTIDEVRRYVAEQKKNGGSTPSIGGNPFTNPGQGNNQGPGGSGGFQTRGGGGLTRRFQQAANGSGGFQTRGGGGGFAGGQGRGGPNGGGRNRFGPGGG